MFKTLFAPSPAKLAGRALYAEASLAARRPAFYLQGGAPDTPEGRFELYLLHVALVLRRLRGQGGEAKVVSQALFDAFVRGLDDGLREMGVGDLSVGKKMRKLGEAIYGRLKAYETALSAPDAAEKTRALLDRTLYADHPSAAGAALLTRYVIEAAHGLADQPAADLMGGRVRFPDFQAAEIAA